MADGCRIESRREEPMVPVFTVVKNGAILKNIFVINNGLLPDSLSSEVRQFNLMDDLERQEEVLIVGRHPDCNILLTHPSISRFHLKILSNPAEQKLSVMDLSSVHGTWISDTRIDPGVLVELKDGDTVRVGGSSRVYRLHWVPLSRAYDCENPFLSALDLAVIEEKEEEHEHQDDYSGEGETVDTYAVTEEAEICQSKDFGVDGNITNQSVDSILESFVASLALHDLEKAANSTELWTPIRGNLSVDRFQRDSETYPDDADDTTKLTSYCLHLEAPSDTENQICSEEQSEQAAPELEKLRGSLEDETHEEKDNSLPGNQWSDSSSPFFLSPEALPHSFSQATLSEAQQLRSGEQAITSLTHTTTAGTPEVGDNDNHSEWAESLSCFSPSLEALAHSFSPATPSEIQNLQLGEQDISPLTCTAAAGTSQSGRNENHSEWLESLSRFSPSMEEFAHSFSPITPLDVGSPLVGERDVTPLLQTVFEKEYYGDSTNRWTSHSVLSLTIEHETEDSSTVADTLIAGGGENHDQNQKRDVPWDHVRSHSHTPKKFLAADNSILSEVTQQHSNEENKEPRASSVKQTLFSDRENETSNVDISATKSNIWSRRGKPAAILQLQTGKAMSKAKSAALKTHLENEQPRNEKENEIINWECSEEEEEIFTPDKENMTPNTRLLKSLHKIGKLKSEEVEEEAEEIFTPDTENMASNTPLVKSLGKMGKSKSEEVIHSRTIRRRPSSKLSCISNVVIDNGILSSEKNRKTKELQSVSHPLLEITGTKKKSARMPFQSLEASSRSDSASLSLHATVERNSAKNEKQNTGKTFSNTCPDNNGQRMNWTMVVDTASFLDKESMKSLQLLRGLKGTRLMIPRMVIRELDCLKQRSSLFRRRTDISSLLEWIEVCMVTTPWWIHAQTSQEEQRSIAPTPPASPCSPQFEVNSPTAEDHILDYAMLLVKTQVDKRVVLISNDVTLKIKAMAEGILCETAREFRASLSSPFSDRFMWTNSTARGRTWSSPHNEALREIYHQRPSKKKQPRRGEGANGLKLILLHNSPYGKQMIRSK